MIRSVEDVGRINRRHCRESFEERFTVQRMVRDYVTVYERLLEGRSLLPTAAMPAILEQPIMQPEPAAGV
jgi:hypothetical protein